jgi:hypothetical protein
VKEGRARRPEVVTVEVGRDGTTYSLDAFLRLGTAIGIVERRNESDRWSRS